MHACMHCTRTSNTRTYLHTCMLTTYLHMRTYLHVHPYNSSGTMVLQLLATKSHCVLREVSHLVLQSDSSWTCYRLAREHFRLLQTIHHAMFNAKHDVRHWYAVVCFWELTARPDTAFSCVLKLKIRPTFLAVSLPSERWQGLSAQSLQSVW